MNFPLYSDIILLHDLPGEGLYAGDVGTIVEQHHVIGLETGYSVEFFNMLGNTVAIATLSASSLRLPNNADRPAVRPMAISA
ncbi:MULTISPECIES: DUF4926 domain-containing protein [Nostocales]|jgi:hypothetical protein|uniref:DUF4926 domain-containing protein n=1 Tax=Dolichospermum flos-aquae UHCC 0037 TaxID=2590026 RepID=A0ACC7S0D0_DOLFA|nr:MULTISPECIES: DUF4926 domain-containing protein [Nostocales]MBO1064019.1 DUF4926 domain-containing protein [Anabaena sp. 54]MTJ41887.1 DUF4926 domain-containing protein [Dolichospermum flos-aquae UHCC 0037]